MIKLKIRGIELQTNGETKFALSKASSKIGELDSRHGDLSVSFTIPLTAFNADLLGGINELLQIGKSAIFTKQDGTVEESGSILSSGYFQVEKTIPIGESPKIHLRFAGGNAQWFVEIKDRSIRGLDLSDLNHTYDLNGVTSSFANTEGYKYFIRYNGKDEKRINNKMLTSDFNLCVFQKTIVDKIFEEAGFKYSGAILNKPQFSTELIPVLRDLSGLEESILTYNWKGESQIVEANADPAEMTFDTAAIAEDPDWTGSTYTSSKPVDNATFVFRAVVDAGFSNVSVKVTYLIDAYGPSESSSTYPLTVDHSDPGVFVFTEENFNGDYTNVPLIAGDYLKFEILYGGGIGSPSCTLLKNSGEYNSYFEYELNGVSGSIAVAGLLPDINQDQLIKDILVRNGMTTSFDASTGTVEFIKNDEAKLNVGTAVDITKLVDSSKPSDISFTEIVKDYGKQTDFKYLKDDIDLIAETFNIIGRGRYGDGYLRIENDFIPDKATLFESNFAPTVLYWTFNENFFLPYIPLFQLEGDGLTYQALEAQPRIMIDAGEVPVNQINRGGYTDVEIKDQRGTFANFTNVAYAFFAKPNVVDTDASSTILNNITDSLRFGDSVGYFAGEGLLESGYSNLERMLNEGHLLSVYLKVTPQQIEDLTPKIPLFLNSKFVSAYYQIDEIVNYSGDGKSVQFKLVKI